MDVKGYISVDFLLSTFIFMIVLVSVITIVEGRFEMVLTAEEAAEERMIVEMVAGIIESTYAAGEGHQMIINMPESVKVSGVKGLDYVVKVRTSEILIQVEGRNGKAFIYPRKIAGGKMGESEVIMFPKRTYIVTNIKDNNGYSLISIKQVS